MSCFNSLFPFLSNSNSPLSLPQRKTSFTFIIGNKWETIVKSGSVPCCRKVNIFSSLSDYEKSSLEQDSFNVVLDKNGVVLLARYQP